MTSDELFNLMFQDMMRVDPDDVPDTELLRAITKYLINEEELYDTEPDTLMMITRFTYGFIEDQT